MKTYRHYEYIYESEETADYGMTTTSMQYITDSKGNILYYNLNGSGWGDSGTGKINATDPNLVLIGKLTSKQLAEVLFVDKV